MKFSLKDSMQWSVFISILTFFLAGVFTVVSTSVMEGVTWGIGVLIVFVLILIGIVFDMMGIASAAAKETPFHAMAAERVKGAKQSIYICRNADRFSSFCNDVIGDISGIVSGGAATLVVFKLLDDFDLSGDSVANFVVSTVFAATVSAMTVGGKAFGKSIAIHNANAIVLIIGRFFYFLEHRLKIKLFAGKKKKANGKRGDKHAARKHKPTE